MASLPAEIVGAVLTGFYEVLGLRELETFYGDEYASQQMTKAWLNVRACVRAEGGSRPRRGGVFAV
jgi:hypothetical protein